MLDLEHRKQLQAHIEQNTIATLGGFALFAIMVMVGGSSAILSAIAGILLSERVVSRPNALPPSWIPTIPGTEEERAQEADVHAFVQAYLRERVHLVIRSEVAVLACVFAVGVFFLPFWPNTDLFS